MTQRIIATNPSDPDARKGAIEGDRPEDVPQQGNDNARALDSNGLPVGEDLVCEDVFGANADNAARQEGTSGAAPPADETGRVSPKVT